MFLMEHFQEGGWGMWPILLLFGITVYICDRSPDVRLEVARSTSTS